MKQQQQFTMTNEAATNHHLASAQIHVVGSASQQQRRQPAQQQQQIEQPTTHSHNHQQQHLHQHQHQQHHHQPQQQQQRLQPQQATIGHLQQHQQPQQQHQQQQQAAPRQHHQVGAASSGGGSTGLVASNHGQSSGSIKKEMPANGKKTKGRVRIKMEFIHNKLRRYTTFSKRKTGIMKKAFELATLTGTQVMLLVASETGHVYTFATRKLQPMIISDAGKALIQTCLNSPDSDNLLMSASSSSTNSANGASTSQPSPSSSSPGSSTPGSSASPASSHQQQQAGNQHSMQQQTQHSGQHQQASSVQYTGAAANSHAQQQQQQATIAAGNNAANSPGNSASLCAPTQSQHNMMLAANAQASSNQTNHGNGGNTSRSNEGATANNQTANGTTTNHANSTTDQRMSATGFEETELSYSINEDLNDRALNNCLPISVGTIAGNVNGSVISSANVITNPQTFEQTLQSQEAADTAVDPIVEACQTHRTTHQHQQHQSRRQQVNGHHQEQQQQRQQHAASKGITTNRTNGQRAITNGTDTTTTAYDITSNSNNKGNSKTPLVEQQQQTSIQLLPATASVSPLQPIQISQFNYNPLYMSAQNFASSQVLATSHQSGNDNGGDDNNNNNNSSGSCSSISSSGSSCGSRGNINSKTMATLGSQHQHHNHNVDGSDLSHQHHHHSQHLNGTEEHHLTNSDDGENSVLADIYHYGDSVATAADSSSCQKQRCHSVSLVGNSTQQQQYCGIQQQHQGGSNLGSYIQTSTNTSGVRKQEIVFANIQQPNQQQRNNSSRHLSPLTNCINQQQQPHVYPESITGQNCADGMSSSSSSPLQGLVGGQRQQRRKQMSDQEQGRKRLSTTATASMNLNCHNHQLVSFHANQQQPQHHQQQQHQHGGQFQQQHHLHQFTVGAGGSSSDSHQLDLSEECNGLFVEYHTNRNSLGELEELHSLNVTNCDSETLEEHINMLSNEDCFATNDDLQDFGIGSTNDHFLNMLLMNSNQGINGQQSNSGAGLHLGQPLESHLADPSGQSINTSMSFGNPIEQLVSNNNAVAAAANQLGLINDISEKHTSNELQQCSPLSGQKPDASQRRTAKSNKKNSVSCSNKASLDSQSGDEKPTTNTDKELQAKRPQTRGSVRNSTTSQSQGPANLLKSAAAAANQNKITTTNTNKRLLPKKTVATGQLTKPVGSKKTTITVNSASCTSTTATTTKHCIANSSSWTASPSSTSNTSNGSALSPSSSSQFEYEAPYRQQLENLRKKLKMDIAPAGTNQCVPTANAAPVTDLRPLKVNESVQKTIAASGASTIVVSQSSELAMKSSTNCLQPTASTSTYILGSHGFETNGTIYVRTSTGLMPINSSSNQRKTGGLPIVSLAGTATTDSGQLYPSATTTTTTTTTMRATPMDSSLIIDCVNGAQYSSGTVTNQQGPTAAVATSVIFQQTRATPSGEQLTNDGGSTDAGQLIISSTSSSTSSSPSTLDENESKVETIVSDSSRPPHRACLFSGNILRAKSEDKAACRERQASDHQQPTNSALQPEAGGNILLSVSSSSSLSCETATATAATNSADGDDDDKFRLAPHNLVAVAETHTMDNQQQLFREQMEFESSLNTKLLPSDVGINVGN